MKRSCGPLDFVRSLASQIATPAMAPVFAAALLVAHSASAGLVNRGFEDGTLDGSPSSWAVDATANEIVVVDSESSAEFAVYGPGQLNVTVHPFRGDAVPPDMMLRMGAPESPGDQNNNQADGSTAVSQTFTATESELFLSTRLFTTEFRPNRDSIRIDLIGPGAPFSIANGDGGAFAIGLPGASCTALPCVLGLDAGGNGDLFDSDWLTFRISGLIPGNDYTLSYELDTGGGSSHPSWVYFDDANNPPVAEFSYNPTSPLEADYIFFLNESYDPDGDALTSSWTFSGPGFSDTQTTQESPPFAFPEDGMAEVTLTVSDGLASDTKTVDLVIANADPKLSALGLQVQQNGRGGLVCRHLDPGIFDPAHFYINGVEVFAPAMVQEHDPTLTTGLAIAEFDATGLAPGYYEDAWTCRVTDGDGGDVTVSADIEVLSDVSDRDEPNNDSCLTAPELAAGGRYAYAIDAPGELDCFEITRENGNALQGNDQVGLLLTDLPADYELVVASLGTSGAGDLEVSPYFTSPYFPSPYFPSPYFPSPYFPSPYFPSDLNQSPYFPSPYFPSPYFPSPYFPSPITTSPYFPSEYNWFPLTQVASLSTGLNNITGKDISVTELGLDSLSGEGLTVKTFSAAPFNLDEQIIVSVSPGERVFAIVKAREGSAAGPYTLQVEASEEFNLELILGDNCVGEAIVPSEDQTTTPQVLHDSGGNTLILTPPPQRFVNLRGIDISAWDDELLPALVRYLDGPSGGPPSPVNHGKIIALPSSIYDARDERPCATELSNAIAQYAAGIVADERAANPALSHVIVVGTDEDIPFLAHIDRTAIGNSSQYQEAFILPGAQLAKISQGLMNTDAHLCGNSVPFQGGQWYIPDCIVARLVESKDDIVNAIDTYLLNPQIDLSGRIHASAYDFLSDGATAVATTLGADDTLIDDPANDDGEDPDVWDSDDARCAALGVTDPDHTTCSVPDFSYINGHMTHAVWLAALGFKQQILEDIVTSLDVSFNAFQNKAVLSVGCHFAMSVFDGLRYPIEAGLPWDSGVDWMQRIVGSGGAAIGSTDFGLGESEGIAGHEELMVDIANAIADGAPTIGEAWLQGIQDFAVRQFDPSEYHQKVIETTALFGPPHYQFTGASPAMAVAAAASLTIATTQTLSEDPAGEAVVELTDGAAVVVQNHDLTKVTVDDGEYFSADPGGFGGAVGNALQPRNSFPLTQQESNIAKGILIRGGQVEDYADWNQVTVTRDYDWNNAVVEPLVCKTNYSPAIPAWINSVPAGNGLVQSANVSLGQFRCTDPSNGWGIERVWRNMELEVTRCGEGPPIALIDFVPPHVTSQLLHVVNGTDVELTLEASDASGIALINVLVIRPDGTVEAFARDVSSEASPYTISLPDAVDQELFWQVEDNNCNVFNGTFKGLLASAIRVEARDGLFSPGVPTNLTATIFNYVNLDTDTATFLWNFGDGSATEGGLLDGLVDVDADGNATFSVPHTYDGTVSPVTATLIVSDATGASGTDTAMLTSCSDPSDFANDANADLIGCTFERVSDTRAAASMYVRGNISRDYQYRARVNDVLMKRDGTKVSGPDSLVVTKIGSNGLRFEFDLADVNWSTTSDNTASWHTQAGVKKQQSVGFPDDMPDAGSFTLPE